VASLAYEYPAGYRVAEHAHGSDQLIYAISGLMEVSAGQSMWLIPPQFCLWIPARTSHRIHMPRDVSMRTLYFRKGLVLRPERRCAVLHVTPLLRELILEAVRIGQLRSRNLSEKALCDLTLLHLKKASSVPTFVTLPLDRRALAIARKVLDDPGRPKPLKSMCREVGAGVRTIQRMFQKDLGTDFESWRRQARLTKAVELLVSGSSVKQTTFAVGYRQPSAFVQSFRGVFGTTPKAWAASIRELPQTDRIG
jgi:AraC-like DNA-binding protein